MTYPDMLHLYFDRSNALQWYWTIYVVVLGGLLGFASMRKQPDRLTTAIVSILYACFAWKNLGAIHDVSEQRAALHTLLGAATDAAAGVLRPTLIAPAWEGTRNFHIACDVLTIGALWAMELRRRRTYTPSA